MSLNLLAVPVAEARVWDALDHDQRALVIEILIEILARLVAKAAAQPVADAMSDPTKVKPTHTHHATVIYVRQSSTAQVEHNRESTERQ